MTIQDRIKQPDNPKWKRIGDIAITVAQPIGVLAIMIFCPAEFKDYAVTAWIGVCNAIKGATKLTTK